MTDFKHKEENVLPVSEVGVELEVKPEVETEIKVKPNIKIKGYVDIKEEEIEEPEHKIIIDEVKQI